MANKLEKEKEKEKPAKLSESVPSGHKRIQLVVGKTRLVELEDNKTQRFIVNTPYDVPNKLADYLLKKKRVDVINGNKVFRKVFEVVK